MDNGMSKRLETHPVSPTIWLLVQAPKRQNINILPIYLLWGEYTFAT